MDAMAFLERMGTSDIALVAAFFIGVMAAVSPCLLATNITAIAYASKKLEGGKHTLLVGILYAAGRSVMYAAIASLIVYAGANTRPVSFFIQEYGGKLLGPLLVVVGVGMLDLVRIDLFKGSKALESLQANVAGKGLLGAFLLGMLFALAFCPISAVLFFGMLIPLAVKSGDAVLLPAVFGLGTGLPVILFSLLLATSVSKLGGAMNNVQLLEKGMRWAVGVVFIIVGAYYTVINW